MNDFSSSDTYLQLRRYAAEENDRFVYVMLNTYAHTPELWETPEQFLADVVLALSAALKGTEARLVESYASRTSPSLCAKCGPDPHWS